MEDRVVPVRETRPVDSDVAGPDDAAAAAVLLHPHPHMGGDRFHPLVDGLHRRLPGEGVGAVRFDFASAEPREARDQVVAAIDRTAERWPDVPIVLVGYSFGAGVAAGVDDGRVVGWFLVAPQSGSLSASPLGTDPRPKVLLVPERDQFSPPGAVAVATDGWAATTLEELPGDHFLAASLGRIIDRCVEWIDWIAADR